MKFKRTGFLFLLFATAAILVFWGYINFQKTKQAIIDYESKNLLAIETLTSLKQVCLEKFLITEEFFQTRPEKLNQIKPDLLNLKIDFSKDQVFFNSWEKSLSVVNNFIAETIVSETKQKKSSIPNLDEQIRKIERIDKNIHEHLLNYEKTLKQNEMQWAELKKMKLFFVWASKIKSTDQLPHSTIYKNLLNRPK